ncbi:MAG TPA: hypothetical protein VM639_18385 [Dongiaceae bacterium]|nr:hypothetical protein [Dongiaceae bacterium]
MSDFDVDIRAVNGASYGARSAASDVSQPSVEDLSSSAAQASVPQPVSGSGSDTVAAIQPQFRYDSFRFLYRSDFGRIVLVDQNPETGQTVSQIPSQRALQLYAEQRQADLRNALSASAADSQGQAGTSHRGFTGAQTAKASVTSAQSGFIGPSTGKVASPPPPTIPTPSPAFLTAAFSPVNITI